jgi:hypothetical protein
LDDMEGGDHHATRSRSRSRSLSPFAHLSRRPPELSPDSLIEAQSVLPDRQAADSDPLFGFSPELVANRAYRANTRRSTAVSSLATHNEAFGDADRTRVSQHAAVIRSARTTLQTLRPVPATVADLSVVPPVTTRISSASGTAAGSSIVDSEWIDPSLAQVRRQMLTFVVYSRMCVCVCVCQNPRTICWEAGRGCVCLVVWLCSIRVRTSYSSHIHTHTHTHLIVSEYTTHSCSRTRHNNSANGAPNSPHPRTLFMCSYLRFLVLLPIQIRLVARNEPWWGSACLTCASSLTFVTFRVFLLSDDQARSVPVLPITCLPAYLPILTPPRKTWRGSLPIHNRHTLSNNNGPRSVVPMRPFDSPNHSALVARCVAVK